MGRSPQLRHEGAKTKSRRTRPIVEEVRRIRAQIAAEHGHDLHCIFEDARRREGADGRPVIFFDKATRDGQSCVVREEPPKP